VSKYDGGSFVHNGQIDPQNAAQPRPATCGCKIRPCVRVSQGVANAVVDKTQANNDIYPLAQVSAKPIPTKVP
jgi:hypothetical protein